MTDSANTSVYLRAHRGVDTVLRWVETLAMLIAAVFLLLIMVLVSLDATLRYAVNMPLAFQYPLTEDYLLIGLVCFTLAWGFRTGGYIRINGIAARLPPLFAQVLLRVGLLVSAGYIGALAWKSNQFFLGLVATGERNIGTLSMPVWISWVWVPVGLGLLFLRLVICAIGPADELHAEHEPSEEL